jgi:two-component system phosphate regulon response regulator OmpR
MTQANILIIDDDTRLRSLLKKYLSESGFLTVSAENPVNAREILEYLEFDLIILDRMMPKESGTEFLEKFRQNSQTPVLMLTAMGESSQRIDGLELGADDYLAKPFEPKELLLRIKSILKRQPIAKPALTINGISTAEETLLNLFIPGKITSREYLASKLGINERAVDVQINRLRKKIEHDPKKAVYIQTIRGEGYKLVME